MIENKSTLLGIIALIIGASGLGLGLYSIVNLQLLDWPSIENTYLCSSQEEIIDALNSIGKGSGTIIITDSITLSSKIEINNGGDYVIQGQGIGTSIDCNGNWNAFDIKNATTCTIKDLNIDSSDIALSSMAIINIDEENDNPVYIENIQIISDSNLKGYGINIGSENVWVSNCYMNKVFVGIYQSSGGNVHISDNTILDCGNIGISLFGHDNIVRENNLGRIQSNAIYISDYFSNCDNNIIIGNYLFDVGGTGIYLDSSNFTIISENKISGYKTYGIFLLDSHSNLISENQIFNGENNGIELYNGDYNIISGNLIFNITKNDIYDCAGIYLLFDADGNSIKDNNVFNCNNYGTGVGYGIEILGINCNDNIVIGNTALNNENNWMNGGTNNYGDYTNNVFS